MPQVNVIDRPTLKNVIRPALDAKLAELSKELGLQITSGSATYGDTTGSFKLNLAIICEDGVVMTEERQAFLDLHELYGLPESALDAEITLSGLRLRIAGIRTKAPTGLKRNLVMRVRVDPHFFTPVPHGIRASETKGRGLHNAHDEATRARPIFKVRCANSVQS